LVGEAADEPGEGFRRGTDLTGDVLLGQGDLVGLTLAIVLSKEEKETLVDFVGCEIENAVGEISDSCDEAYLEVVSKLFVVQ